MTSQFGVETDAKLDEGREPAIDYRVAATWFDDAGEDSQQGGLACAVMSDQAKGVTMLHGK